MNQIELTPTYPTLLKCRSEGLMNVRRLRSHLFSLSSPSLSLLSSPRIDCPDKSISSLQVHHIDSRYLLTGSREGNLSIYDLSRFGADLEPNECEDTAAVFRHKPIARSITRHRVIKAQWYPMDSGAFASISTDGEFFIWDANGMVPVCNVRPFQYESRDVTALPSCMDLSGTGNMAATGSSHVGHIKLIDVRTAACAHSLVGHSRGLSVVQWSPTNEYILASGGYDCAIHLWDIRKAGNRSCLVSLDRDMLVGDDTMTLPYTANYAHLRRTEHHRKKRKLVDACNVGVVHSNSSTAHKGYVTGLSFTSSGHRIVSTGSEGSLHVWDLRKQGERLPIRFQSPGAGLAIDRSNSSHRVTPLWVEGDETIWAAKGSNVYAFNMLQGGNPTHYLKGHIMPVLSITDIPYSGRLLTGGNDGLILCWGHAKIKNEPIEDTGMDNW